MTSQCHAIAGPSTSQAFEQWKRKCNEMSLHLAAIVMGLSWGSSLWPPFKLFFCSFFSWMHPFGIWGFPEDRMFLSFGNHVEHRPAFLYYLFGNWANNRGKVYDVQHTCALCRGGNSVICRGGCRGELSGPHYILWLRLYDDHSLTTQGQGIALYAEARADPHHMLWLRLYDEWDCLMVCRGRNSAICRGGRRGELPGPHHILWLRLYGERSRTVWAARHWGTQQVWGNIIVIIIMIICCSIPASCSCQMPARCAWELNLWANMREVTCSYSIPKHLFQERHP